MTQVMTMPAPPLTKDPGPSGWDGDESYALELLFCLSVSCALALAFGCGFLAGRRGTARPVATSATPPRARSAARSSSPPTRGSPDTPEELLHTAGPVPLFRAKKPRHEAPAPLLRQSASGGIERGGCQEEQARALLSTCLTLQREATTGDPPSDSGRPL